MNAIEANVKRVIKKVNVNDTYHSKLKQTKKMLKVNCFNFDLLLQLYAEANLKIVIPFVSHASNFAEFSYGLTEYIVFTNAKMQFLSNFWRS